MKILMVGGGTGGHIVPLLPLVRASLDRNLEVTFVAGESPLDRSILRENFPLDQLTTYFLSSEKIRYYFSWKNFIAPFFIIRSFFIALEILRKERPDFIFFKGGFVCLPVLVAARFFPQFLSGFSGKIFLHESDISQSRLAKLIERYADRTFYNFPKEYDKAFYLYYGRSLAGRVNVMPSVRKSLLVFGGSQGAQFINTLVERNLEELCKKYDVKLVTGMGKQITELNKASPYSDNFVQYEILPAAVLAEKIKKVDLIISRASGSIFQILEARKRSILIPLPSAARDHQTANAQYFSKKKLATMLLESEASDEHFLSLIDETLEDEKLGENLKKLDLRSMEQEILDEILLFCDD